MCKPRDYCNNCGKRRYTEKMERSVFGYTCKRTKNKRACASILFEEKIKEQKRILKTLSNQARQFEDKELSKQLRQLNIFEE